MNNQFGAMEDNEDEPDDVRKATPVEEEIKKGAVDEDSGQPTKLPETAKKRHQCEAPPKKKLKEKSEGECCRAREAKATKAPKYATVLVYEKKCTLPRLKPIPRHCITKQEWIDTLATPGRRCPSPPLQKSVTRRIRPVSARMAELGQPPKQRMINTLQAKAGILPIEMVDRLIQRIETETCLSPEQAEKMFRDKESSKKKCPKSKKGKTKCESGRSGILEAGISASGSPFDREAVNCQYAMAESFVKSILDWECPIPREEFKDISNVILKRLGYLLEYEPINGEDRKSQQMRFLADVIGSWISGVLFEVAEVRRTQLEEECERRKKEIAEESEEESDDESQDDYPRKYDDDDDDDDEDDDGKPGGGKKPEGDEEKKEEKRPISRAWAGFRLSKDQNGKDDDDKDKERKSSKKGSGESEKDSPSEGKRKSSDADEFYDARTGESQEIGEKKTPMKEPEVAKEKLEDLTPGKMPEKAEIEADGQKAPEVMKDDSQPRSSDDKLGKIDSPKQGVIEEREKAFEAEDLPVTSTTAIEKREDKVPEKMEREVPPEVQRVDDQDRKQSGVVEAPEIPKTMNGPEAVPIDVDTTPPGMAPHSEDSSALSTMKEAIPDDKGKAEVEAGVAKTDKKAIEPDKSPSTEKPLPSEEETTKPEVIISDPEKTPKPSKETDPQKKKSTDDEERRKSEAEAVKMDDPFKKGSKTSEVLPPITPDIAVDTKIQFEEKEQTPKASIGRKEETSAEPETERIIEQLPKLDREPEIPEVKPEVPVDTRAMPGQEQEEIPKDSIGDKEIKEIEAEAEKMAVPPTKLDTTAEVPETRPEAAEMKPEVPRAVGEDSQIRPSEAVETRPESMETHPEVTADTESKIKEPKKISEDSTIADATKVSWDEAKAAETDRERKRILDTSKRSSDRLDQLEKKFSDLKEIKKPKEYPHSTVIDKKFRNDTPFVTFDKIFHTIYNAIEKNAENNGDDPITNRIHRAVYEKCSNIVQEEKPGQLSPLTKDVLEVMSGKIAIWLRNILTESQMNFVNQFPATVESTEVREWTSWISFISNTADDWSNWIQKTIKQAEGMSNRPITRRDWANWTENVDTDALKWRRFYLESVHQAHQNFTMIRDRQVVKTGTKQFHDHNDQNEKEVKTTDLEVVRRRPDPTP